MADELKVYGLCSANCKHQVLTVDQTAALIQEMAANGFQVPDGFIPTTAVNKIVEQNSGTPVSLFIGTQAEYDAWTGDKDTTFAILTDDPAYQELMDKLNSLNDSVSSLDKSVDNIVNGKVGEVIYSRKVLLFNSDSGVTSYKFATSPLNRKFEIEYEYGTFLFSPKKELTINSSDRNIAYITASDNGNNYFSICNDYFSVYNLTLNTSRSEMMIDVGSGTVTTSYRENPLIYKIYEIIE